MHADQKAGEPRRTHAFLGQFECACSKAFRGTALRTGFHANSQKEPRHGLKLMNAAAKMRSIGFEKNKMTSLRDRSNQMRNTGMMQRLASSDPHDRRAAGNNFANLFMRNRMVGVVMQNFCHIHNPNGAYIWCKTQYPQKPGSGDVRRKPQGKPQHVLKPTAQPEFAGLELQRG